MPEHPTATDELLAIRRQEEALAQERHDLTLRQVREQEKLLVALRQSRICTIARLRWADGHGVGYEDAGDILGRIDAAIANARKGLDWLRAREQEERCDLVAASPVYS